MFEFAAQIQSVALAEHAHAATISLQRLRPRRQYLPISGASARGWRQFDRGPGIGCAVPFGLFQFNRPDGMHRLPNQQRTQGI